MLQHFFPDLDKYLLLSAKTQNSIATLSAMPQKALRMIFVNSKPPLSQNEVGSIGPSLASSSTFAPSFSGSSKKVQTRLLVYGHWHQTMYCVLASCLCQDVPDDELQETWNRLSHEENRIF